MENAFPCFVMLVATGICAYLPAANVLNRRLSLRGDVLLLLFWYQSWIYLHVVPTINGLFPNSSFAYPPGFEDMRVIQFTSANLGWYAVFQVMVLVLFYIPLMCAYRHFKRKAATRRVEADPPRSSVQSDLLVCLALSYSIFGFMFYEVATRTGLLSPYAMSLDVFASISRYDRWVWRIYVIANPFLFTIIMLAFFERNRRVSIIPFAMACAPGVVFNAAWLFSSSRATLVFLITGTIGILIVRGHIRRPSKHTCLGMAASVFLLWYGLSVIPTLRAVVLEDTVGVEDCLVALNPFSANKGPNNSGTSDIGFRLDGIELMVLAAPRMLEIGPLFDSRYLTAILSPVMPILPSLERSLKFEEQTLDFKQFYLARYTDILLPDYPAGALADIFIVLGPLGFCVAAVTYGWLFTWIHRLIAVPTSRWSIVLGVFFYYNVSLYEFPFASVPLGWVRGLPVLLVALLFNPFWYGGNRRHRGLACVTPNQLGPPCRTGAETVFE